MSVLIKGMKMPKDCGHCKFRYITHMGKLVCQILSQEVKMKEFGKRPKNCPLIEVLSPHGDLTDKDKLMQEFMDSDLDHLQRDDWKEVIQIVADAPTIIEAEGSKE